MGFEGIFRKTVFGRKGVEGASRGFFTPPPPPHDPLHPALEAELGKLDLYRPGLAREAKRFVATGEPLGFAANLAALEKATPRHANPYHLDTSQLPLVQSETAKAVFTGEIAPGPQVARLMALRQAAGINRSYAWSGLSSEQQTLYCLKAMLGFALVSRRYTETAWQGAIALTQVQRHFESLGAGLLDLFDFLFERQECAQFTPGSWQDSAELKALIHSHPATFTEAARVTSPDRRARALTFAERHGATGLPEVEALLLAMLEKPFGKADHTVAVATLARFEGEALLAIFDRTFAAASVDVRARLVEAAGRNGAPGLLARLAELAPAERAGKVKAAFAAVLEMAQDQAEVPAPTGGEEPAPQAPGYRAVDGSFVAIPAFQPIPAEPIAPPSDQECIDFMALVDAISAERAAKLATLKPEHYDYKRHLPYTREEIEETFTVYTQGIRQSRANIWDLHVRLRMSDAGQAWIDGVLNRISPASAVRVLVYGARGFLDPIIKGYNADRAQKCSVDRIIAGLEAGHYDLRALLELDREVLRTQARIYERASEEIPDAVLLRTMACGGPYHSQTKADYRSPLASLPRHAVWPLVADNIAVLDEALGLKAGEGNAKFSLIPTLALIELLPALPQRWVPKLVELALTAKRDEAKRVRTLLKPVPDLPARLEALLDDQRQQVRIGAASWLADLRSAASEGALRARFKKEKAEPVRAALVTALRRLGADLADVIGPAVLGAEAQKAAAKGLPDLPQWLVMGGLPQLRWQDGSALPQQVLHHWLALAIKLKDPAAHAQFGIYLDALADQDARTLSDWVLESWISYDTHTSNAEEATAYALANYTSDWRWQYRPQTAELREQIIAELIRAKAGELLNSGSDTKGMLALACRADPAWAAGRVSWFLKKHGRRSNQAMALLEVLAGIGAPAALQVVIAASARLKQKSTQARAAEIAQRYAEDRGWSFDELADRTVPSAGFDDDGVLDLPCGEDQKPYLARLDAMLQVHLFNPDGKAIKSLPAGDDEHSKESKKALAAAKKELGQVVQLQATRLFEAMCLERSWPVEDWRMAFHQHPVMRRLIERLVWQGLDAEGNPQGLFRPTQEGDFTDAHDGAVDIDGFATVRLAHGALVDPDTCKAWIAHLKDYEVKPFLTQFDALRAPLSVDQAKADLIDDRQGWKALSMTYRGVIEKRGYQRVMRDGGGCNEYAKQFPSQGITVTIFHTGSYAVDENNPVALKELRFTQEGQRGALRLDQVPPVLLAESWADYHALATKGEFDPEWEKASPW